MLNLKFLMLLTAGLVSGCFKYEPMIYSDAPTYVSPSMPNHFQDRGADKAKHLGVGLAVASYVSHRSGSPTKGCVAALAVGVAKEAWDALGNGTPSVADAVATGAGCGFTYRF